jgi:hypothetical protein
MSDFVRLTFADGTAYKIEVAAGTGDSTAAEIRDGKGDYSKGWLVDRDDYRKTMNLAMIVSIQVQSGSDPLIKTE